jgi:hypothetical protein
LNHVSEPTVRRALLSDIRRLTGEADRLTTARNSAENGYPGVIYGLTIQKVGKRFELRCPECTILTGRLGLVRQEDSLIRLHCPVHPENFGQWHSDEEMEREKRTLAERIGLA